MIPKILTRSRPVVLYNHSHNLSTGVWSRSFAYASPATRAEPSVTSSNNVLNADEKLVVAIAEDLVANPNQYSHSQILDMTYDLGEMGFEQLAEPDLLQHTLRSVGRVLHPLALHGYLSPFEVAKLSRAYGMLRNSNVTFARACSQSVSHYWSSYKNLLGTGECFTTDVIELPPKDYKRPDTTNTGSLGLVAVPSDELGLYPYFDERMLSDEYDMGFGIRSTSKPLGLPMIPVEELNTYQRLVRDSFREDLIDFNSVTKVNAAYLRDSFSIGQMMSVLDGVLQTRIMETCAPETTEMILKSCDDALQRLSLPNAVASLDSKQITSAMIVLARSQRGDRDYYALVQRLTDRAVHLFMLDAMEPQSFALFLKEVAYWSSYRRKYTFKSRTHIRFDTTRFRPRFLVDAQKNNLDLGLAVAPIARVCQRICENIQSFRVNEMSLIVQAVAEMGFYDPNFYKALSPWFLKNMEQMSTEDVQRVMQAFNRAKIEDRQLFYKLGLRHQLLQAKRQNVHLYRRSELISRIG